MNQFIPFITVIEPNHALNNQILSCIDVFMGEWSGHKNEDLSSNPGVFEIFCLDFHKMSPVNGPVDRNTHATGCAPIVGSL